MQNRANSLAWLDKHIAEQRCNASLLFGNPNAVSQAAEAVEIFGEDALEAYRSEKGGSHASH